MFKSQSKKIHGIATSLPPKLEQFKHLQNEFNKQQQTWLYFHIYGDIGLKLEYLQLQIKCAANNISSNNTLQSFSKRK